MEGIIFGILRYTEKTLNNAHTKQEETLSEIKKHPQKRSNTKLISKLKKLCFFGKNPNLNANASGHYF